LDKTLRLKTYESKILIIFFLILILTVLLFFPIFTYTQIKEEIEFATKGIKNAVKIRSSLFEKRLKILESSLKNLSEKELKTIPYVVGYKVDKKTYNFFDECSKKNKKVSLCKNDLVYVKLKEGLEVIVNKNYFKDVLDAKKGMISVYKPVFFLDTENKNTLYDICFYKTIFGSDIYLIGCVNKSEIIKNHILSSLKQGLFLSLFFLVISYFILKLRLKDIILFPIFYLKKKLEKFDIEKVDKVKFDLQEYVEDEFGSLSNSLEKMRLSILRYNEEIELILDTTSKMVSFTNDIYKFILFTLNKIEKIFENIIGKRDHLRSCI
jgi:hypothetical protein